MIETDDDQAEVNMEVTMSSVSGSMKVQFPTKTEGKYATVNVKLTESKLPQIPIMINPEALEKGVMLKCKADPGRFPTMRLKAVSSSRMYFKRRRKVQ